MAAAAAYEDPHTASTTSFSALSKATSEEFYTATETLRKKACDRNIPVIEPRRLADWRGQLRDPKTRHQLVRLLARTAVFAEASEAFRSAVCDSLVPAEYEPGQVVFRINEPGDWMGIILTGRYEKKVQRPSGMSPLAQIGPGAIIGDAGLFGISTTRSFTVTALTSSAMLVLTAPMFEEAVAKQSCPASLNIFRDSLQMKNILQDADAFCNLQCFKKLDREFVMQLRAHSEPRLCYPNQVLIRENQFGDEMYILRAGTVKVEKDRKLVVELHSGVVLGDLAVMGQDKRRTATVTCQTICVIRALHADVFHEIVDKFPGSKRIFDHQYIARITDVEVRSSKEHVQQLNAFYGTAMPKTKLELQKMIGSTINIDATAGRDRTLSQTPRKTGLCLPRLSPVPKLPALAPSPMA